MELWVFSGGIPKAFCFTNNSSFVGSFSVSFFFSSQKASFSFLASFFLFSSSSLLLVYSSSLVVVSFFLVFPYSVLLLFCSSTFSQYLWFWVSFSAVCVGLGRAPLGLPDVRAHGEPRQLLLLLKALVALYIYIYL